MYLYLYQIEDSTVERQSGGRPGDTWQPRDVSFYTPYKQIQYINL